MGDFDITNVQSKGSFMASLKKRKAYGLLDSDSEDEAPPTKKPQRKKDASTNSIDLSEEEIKDEIKEDKLTSDTNIEKSQNDVEEITLATTSQPNPYLSQLPDLDLINVLSSSPTASIKSEIQCEQSTPAIDILDESEDDNNNSFIENLDPELEALFNKTTPTQVHEPEKISIKLQYTHNYLDLSEKTNKIIDKLLKPMKLIIMDNTQFDKILKVFCDHKKLKKDELVMVYNDDKVFLTGTPIGVGMTASTPNVLKVYPRNCYETFLQEKERERQEKLKKWADDNKKDDDIFGADALEVAPVEDDQDKIVIKLRSNNNQEVRIRVKNDSTIESVIAKYKELSKTTNTKVNLSFEGEVLDPESTIADADMEDDDLVEVLISN